MKDLLKIHKIPKNSIENEFLNEKKISIKGLNCLALINKINIIYIKNRIIFIMNYSNESIDKCKNIIYEKDKEITLITLSEDSLKEIINSYYNIININKPINAISYYKLDELIRIAKQLNLDIENCSKKQIYEKIYNIFY